MSAAGRVTVREVRGFTVASAPSLPPDSKEELDEEDGPSLHIPRAAAGEKNKVHTVMETQSREGEGAGSGCCFGRFLLQRSSV